MRSFFNTLSARIWLPLFGFLFTMILVMGVYFPERQKQILSAHQDDQFQALANTMALGIEISLNQDNYEGLAKTMNFIENRQDIAYAAVLVIDEHGDSHVLASYPSELTESQIKLDQESSSIKSQHFQSKHIQGEVLIAVKKSEVLRGISEINNPVYVLLLAVMGLTTVLYFSNSKKISRPIREITAIAQELRKKNYSVSFSTTRVPREIKELKGTLRQLRDELVTRERENDKLNRTMEQTIEKRTEELQKALSDLEFSEAIVKNVIDSALDAVVTANERSEVIEWNKKAEEVFGYTYEEAIGKTLSELIIPEQHAEAHHKGMDRYMKHGIGPVLNKQIQISARKKNGEIIDIELFITPIHLEDTTLFSSFMRDITDRLASEKRLEHQRKMTEAILDAIPINISLKNRENRYIFINSFLQNRLGLNDSDWLGKTDREIHGEHYSEAMHVQDQSIWEKGPMDLREEMYVVNDQQHHILSGKIILEADEMKTIPDYLLSFSFDITHQKEVELKLKNALAAKDEFLSTMSHEIRTPLHSIIATSELLNQTGLSEKEGRMLRNLNFSSKHLLGLINDILDFSKINSGKLELHYETANFAQLMQDIYQQFDTSSSPSLNYLAAFDLNKDLMVEVDVLRFSQIITNLLSNAFRFTDSGEVNLRASHSAIENGLVHVTISVEDTGIGIHPDNLKRISQAFVQENASISRKYGGTGLGLSIVNSLLKAMKSELFIDSKINEGSTFSFQLCLAAEQKVEAPKVPVVADLVPESFQLHLLYVEDLLPNQIVMEAMLEQIGVSHVIASSAMEALETTDKEAFDLILMDIQMPEIDGTQALQLLRARQNMNASTPVVAFTANAETTEIQNYLSLGFSAVLTKPITPQKLRSFLQPFSKFMS